MDRKEKLKQFIEQTKNLKITIDESRRKKDVVDEVLEKIEKNKEKNLNI